MTSPTLMLAGVPRRRLKQAIIAAALVLLATTLFYGDVTLMQRSTRATQPQMHIQPQEAESPQATHDVKRARAMAVSATAQEKTTAAVSSTAALERELVLQTRKAATETPAAATPTVSVRPTMTQPTAAPTLTPTTMAPTPAPTPEPSTPKPTPALTSLPPAPVPTPAHTTAPPTTLSHTTTVPPAFSTASPKPTPALTTPSPVVTPASTAWSIWTKPNINITDVLGKYNIFASTPAPTPSPTADPWFANVEHFPENASTHNETFVTRSPAFDQAVPRDKGILLCLHDKAMALGLSLIKELRCLGNHELIQVYHCLASDLSAANKQLLVSQDNRLEIIDVCGDLMHAEVFTALQAKQFKSWWVKPLAIHHTNLNEPILLDADDIILQDPAVLRDSEGYRANGTLFFYDRVIEERNFFSKKLLGRGYAPILRYIIDTFDYAAFGLSGPKPSEHLLASFAYQDKTCHEMDSSMVAIDKTRAGKAMDVLWWLTTSLRLKVQFSHGDKEAFWLAYELAQEPYAFSPWGVSVVSTSASNDMEEHPTTLCGSIAQYLPSPESEPAQLLYVNGKALLDPLSQGVDNRQAKPNIMYNANATHAVPRMPRTPRQSADPTSRRGAYSFPQECLVGLGSTPLPSAFQRLMFRRRLHYLAVSSGIFEPLAVCEFRWQP